VIYYLDVSNQFTWLPIEFVKSFLGLYIKMCWHNEPIGCLDLVLSILVLQSCHLYSPVSHILIIAD
jgi:hypothetical protein